MADRDRRIADAFAREGARLRGFIRRRVATADEVEDVLQDVFSDLVEAMRLPRPIEHLSAWLFEVARRRIADTFRRRGHVAAGVAAVNANPNADAADDAHAGRDGSSDAVDADALRADPPFEDLLPSADAGPEAAYTRRLFLEALDDALAELPAAQREVFLAHELDGRSFKSLAAERGVSVNTLLSQKHYAVRHLRRRLEALREEILTPEPDDRRHR